MSDLWLGHFKTRICTDLTHPLLAWIYFLLLVKTSLKSHCYIVALPLLLNKNCPLLSFIHLCINFNSFPAPVEKSFFSVCCWHFHHISCLKGCFQLPDTLFCIHKLHFSPLLIRIPSSIGVEYKSKSHCLDLLVKIKENFISTSQLCTLCFIT